jgi:beta-lactam-binding protein with PASTA domain
VLEQLYNGVPIPAGTKVRQGSRIALVIGTGVGNIDIPVPKLIGLTYAEARILLQEQGLIVGAVIPDPLVRDTLNAFVYKQNPEPKNEEGFQFRIRPGQMMDIWVSLEPPVTDSLKKKVKPKTDDQ